MPLRRETLAQVEQFLKALCIQVAELQERLDKTLHADDGVHQQARNLDHSVTEAKELVDVALGKCALLKTGEVPLTEESSAELTQMVNQLATCFQKELCKLVPAKGVSASGLDTLSGAEFEGLITRLLERMGFRAEMTKASGDGGVDIVATLDQPVTGGRYLIQCKRYAPDSLVGAPVLREFYGVLTADRRAVKGILITTSGFTAQAQEFAGGLPIELIGRDQLQRLLEQHGLLTEALGPHPDSVVGAAPQPKDRASELLDLATKMREQNRYAEAIKLLREATQLRPDDPDVWLWLGICYDAVGLHDEQTTALREAVRLKPDFGKAWSWLGSGLYAVGNLDAAADALKQALTIQPDDYNTLFYWGRICRDKGDKEGARLAFQKAVKIQPDSVEPWFHLGFFHLQQRDNAEAVSAFGEALRIDPNHADSWEFLFYAYSNLGNRPRMLQALSRLEQLNPAKARDLRRDLI